MPGACPRRPSRHADPAALRGQRRRSASGPRGVGSNHRTRSLRNQRSYRGIMTTSEAAPTPTLPPKRGRESEAEPRTGGGLPTSATALSQAKRLVVKIGSALLVGEDGEIDRAWLDALVDDLARCRARRQEIIVVSSGAIAVGRRHLGLRGAALRLEEKQAAASTGQIRLAHAYQEALARHGLTVAQILLTPEDTEERRRHLNARATLTQLLALKAIPVINENDTVATAEIRFGDNDRLAARVAQMVSADTLVLLSDIDGLYTADPRSDAKARHIAEVRELSADIEAMAGAAPPGMSSGGMVTKLAAARIAMTA